jgi:hypothetical protein
VARSVLDRLLAPWVFVLTGIIFNILSAVITHYFIGLNDERINAIDRLIRYRQVLIDSLWQSRIEIERKEEFFILYLADAPAEPTPARDYFRDYLDQLVSTHELEAVRSRLEDGDPSRLELLLDLSEAARDTVVDSINNTYLETLEMQETKMPLERANSRLFSIAIFLQVTGLILVLARDLRRQ